MHISEFSVKRPVFASVISLLLVAIGVLSFTRLPVREYPDINPPVVSIDTRYTGASASVVDTRITQVIENRISGIEGIRTISSSSEDGRSRINIEFELSRDIDAAANDVRDRVSRVLSNLPTEVDPPEISKADASADVLMWLNLASDTLNSLELTDYARRFIVDQLSTVRGVAMVRVGGAREYSMRVWLDREALAARGLVVADIENALRAENVELPAGRIESLERYFTLRTRRNFNTAEDFAGLVVQRGSDGHFIRLGEVARVEVGAVEHRQTIRGNGQEMVGLGIVPLSTANALEVGQGIKAMVARINSQLPDGLRIFESFDRTVFIDQSIREIYKSLGIALGLVVLVIFVFLGSVRAVLIPAVTVPISLTSSLIFLYFMGYSINLLTLLALLLAIGLVVDDAIVVLENIHRRIRLGESPGLAAVRGARQVSFAVIATTIVLISVFVPLGFQTGNTGRLFTEFAFALAAAVGFSSLVALTLSPVMCSLLLKGRDDEGRLAHWVDSNLDRMSTFYRRVLSRAVSHPVWVGLVVLLVVALAVSISRRVPVEFAPDEDRGVFFLVMTGPEGASYEYSLRYMLEAERETLSLVESGEAIRVLTRVPGAFGDPTAFNSGRSIIVLAPWPERRPIREIQAEMRQRLDRLAGVRVFPVARSGLSRQVGEPVQFVIGGSTYEELVEWQQIILDAAAENPGLLNLDTDYKQTKPQMLVRVIPERAADLGVSLRQIGQTLETFFGSRRATTYIDRGEEYDVILQGEAPDRQTSADLENVYVRSERSGQLIPLSNLIEIEEFADAAALNRFNRLRAVTISANLADGYTLGEALAYLEDLVREKLPESAQIDYRGESREFVDAQGAIYFIFAFALLVVFLVLAAQFESFIHPLTILLTVPLAVVGALAGLWITSNTLNIFSQIGLVMLIGLAAKNGILIVEFTNQLRDQGLAFGEAVLRAAQLRLRPVIMTAVSTVFGATPLILATGAGAENRITIGVVIFAGVAFSSIMTIFTVPWSYSLIGRFTGSPGERGKRIDAEAAKRDFIE